MKHATPMIIGLLALFALAPARAANGPASKPSTRPTPASAVVRRLADCPKPVQRTLRAEVKGAGIDSVDVDPGEEGQEDYYVAEVQLRGHTYEITVAEDGQLIEKRMANDSEKTLALDECPKAVRDALVDEAGGARIDEVERDVRHGTVTFTAGIDTDDGYYWIVVARDGTLLDKYLDDSDQDPGPQPSDAQRPQQA